MRFMTWCLILAECLVFFTQANHKQDPCLRGLEPIQDFQMSRFLGQWYVIQDAEMFYYKCLTYNYDYTPEKVPGEYVLNITKISRSDSFPFFLTSEVFNLTVSQPNTLGLMETEYITYYRPYRGFRFQNVFHVVFMTDYITYAGVVNYLPNNNPRKATILSRTNTLDQMHVDKIRQKLSQCGYNLSNLEIIDHSDCPEQY